MENFSIQLIGNGCPNVTVRDITQYQNPGTYYRRVFFHSVSANAIVYNDALDLDQIELQVDTYAEGLDDVDTNNVYMFAVPIVDTAPSEIIPENYILYTTIDNSGTSGLGIGLWRATTSNADFDVAADWESLDTLSTEDLFTALEANPPATDLNVVLWDKENLVRNCGIPANTPNITNLASGDIYTQTHIDVEWVASHGATYELYLGVGSPVLLYSGLTTNHIQVSLIPGNTYELYVKAINVYGNKQGTQISIIIESENVYLPEYVYPIAEQQISNASPKFRWVDNDPNNIFTGNLLILEEKNGTWGYKYSTSNAGLIGEYSLPIALSHNKEYRWKILPMSNSGVLSNPNWAQFTVYLVYNHLGKVTTVTPVSASTVYAHQGMVTFSWTALVGAVNYILRIYEGTSSALIREVHTSTTSINVLLPEDIVSYKYSVVPIDANGIASNVAPDLISFSIYTKVEPGLPGFINPSASPGFIDPGDDIEIEAGSDTVSIYVGIYDQERKLIKTATQYGIVAGDLMLVTTNELQRDKKYFLVVVVSSPDSSVSYQREMYVRKYPLLTAPDINVNGVDVTTNPSTSAYSFLVVVTPVVGAEKHIISITDPLGKTILHEGTTYAGSYDYPGDYIIEAWAVNDSQGPRTSGTVTKTGTVDTHIPEYVLAKIECYKWMIRYFGTYQGDIPYRVTTLDGEIITEGMILEDETEVVFEVPQGDNIYTVYVGTSYEACLVAYEFCAVLECRHKMINQLLCGAGCLDISGVQIDCDEIARINDDLLRYNLMRFDVLYNELMLNVNMERVKYLFINTVSEERTDYLNRVKEVLDLLNSLVVNCGFCNGM